jgi:hypothetical protein
MTITRESWSDMSSENERPPLLAAIRQNVPMRGDADTFRDYHMVSQYSNAAL